MARTSGGTGDLKHLRRPAATVRERSNHQTRHYSLSIPGPLHRAPSAPVLTFESRKSGASCSPPISADFAIVASRLFSLAA